MNSTIRCRKCSEQFSFQALGTRNRNHCPYCLWSVHLDHRPGDRAVKCGGLMEPIAISLRADGEWTIVHRCTECGTLHANRVAGDDNAVGLLQLAARPLANPPFPSVC
ncbi:MAG: RNHCP domain-containing protein [Pontiellaceae bacterium]|nr:RNHCP domain-containing protein [Pontiellaceae bacterium]